MLYEVITSVEVELRDRREVLVALGGHGDVRQLAELGCVAVRHAAETGEMRLATLEHGCTRGRVRDGTLYDFIEIGLTRLEVTRETIEAIV